MVPYLSCTIQKWAGNVDCLFKVKQLEASNQRDNANSSEELFASLAQNSVTDFIRNIFGARSVSEAQTHEPAPNTGKVEWIKWTDIKDRINSGDVQQNDVAFAKLKLIPRIIEKTARCYKGDFSRLTDLCRCAVAFETIEDLTRYLELILDDPVVEVVRIKNRLDSTYNCDNMYGYRDVNLNLRIVNSPVTCLSDQDWRRLGLCEHMCEIQLLTLSYAQEKTQHGHTKYIRYRNLSAQ